MLPQVALGGGTPKPRKERLDSVRMAPATPRVAETRTGPSALGTRCRKMTRRPDAPTPWAAWTKSRSRSDRISARTKRAVPSQLVRPMTTMMFQIDGLSTATTVRIRKKVGNESITSMRPVIRVSTPSATRPTPIRARP